MTGPRRVWVLDASAIIRIKRAVPARQQWGLLERLKEMVVGGEVFLPRAVVNELHQNRHIDTPEAWALDAGPRVTLAYDPSDESWQFAMERAGDVVDSDAEDEPGDPKVLAQALDLRNAGLSPCVVTEDVIDRLPIKISLLTACVNRLGLECCTLKDFLAQIGFFPDTDVTRPTSNAD